MVSCDLVDRSFAVARETIHETTRNEPDLFDGVPTSSNKSTCMSASIHHKASQLSQDRQRRIQQSRLKVEQTFVDHAGVTSDGDAAGQIGQHYALAKFRDHFRRRDHPYDFLIQTVTQIIKVRRSRDEKVVIDQHRL